MEVNETALPGVGVRYDLETENGQRVAVVAHHSGRRDLVVYERSDPDESREVLSLTRDEADDLADVLGAVRLAGPLADLQQQIEGLAIDWLPIQRNGPFDNHPLGDTKARTLTGVSIVAVLRNKQALPSPTPDFVLTGGDTIVVVGTPDGIRKLIAILQGGHREP